MRSGLGHDVLIKLASELTNLSAVEIVEETASTQLLAAQAAKDGAEDSRLFFAEHQTSGRGRSGRSWWSEPRANILMSWLVRTQLNPSQITTLPFHFGLAISRALDPWTGDALRLKWPNDLLLDEKKLGGILAESVPAHGGKQGCVVILGLGLNVDSSPNDFPADIQNRGTSLSAFLSDAAPSRTEVAAAILTQLNVSRPALEKGTVPRAQWLQRAAWINEKVAIQQDGARLEGIFLGIEDDGSLSLGQDDGSVIRIAHGDLLRQAN